MGNIKFRDGVPLAVILLMAFSLIGPSVPAASAEVLPSIGDNQLHTPLSAANSPALLPGTDDWTLKSPVGGTKPSARSGPAMANIGGDQILLFGGSSGGDETWVYDLSTNTWTNKSLASKPSSRFYHGMAYIGDDQVLLFGGWDTTYDDETWVYDLSANTWTEKSPASKPSAREFPAMAYIGGDQVLLFGGGVSAGHDDETWVYDLSANTWTKKSPSSSPSGRSNNSALANIGGDQVLLFGGWDGASDDETWVYDLSANSWTQKSPASKPSARHAHSMASIGGDQVLLFGGTDGAADDETWIYDLSENNWKQRSPASKPSARIYFTMANLGGEQVLLFGGNVGGDETWVYLLSHEIFTDGFESGDLTVWDAAKTSSTDLKACTKAALNGTYGLCVKNKTKKVKFVQDDGFTETSYSYQFNLDPNGIKVKNKKKIRLVQAKGSSNTTWMEFRRKSGTYQIRAWAGLDGGGTTKTSWYSISNAPHLIEVDWSASSAPGADDGFLRLYKDDVLKQEISGLDNDTFDIQKIKLGITKTVPKFTEKFYLDDFKSTDGGHIGP